MNEKAQQLITRTAAFARSVLELAETVQQSDGAQAIKRQLIDAATSVAANYRAACRARSRAEFVAKIGLVREEADESVGWLEMLIRLKYVSKELAEPILNEANELTAITNASYKTARRGRKPRPPSPSPSPSQSSIPE